MKYACNYPKHQNNKKKNFTILRWVNVSQNLDNTMVKCIIKFKKIYKKKLWDRSQSNCYSGTEPLLQGTGPMLWGPGLGSLSHMSNVIALRWYVFSPTTVWVGCSTFFMGRPYCCFYIIMNASQEKSLSHEHHLHPVTCKNLVFYWLKPSRLNLKK